MPQPSLAAPDGTIACYVREFAQPHAFGPYPPGAVVFVGPHDLKVKAIAEALIPVEEFDRQEREKAERAKSELEGKLAALEASRQQAIASHQAAKEAEERRAATLQPGPVTAPGSSPAASKGRRSGAGNGE